MVVDNLAKWKFKLIEGAGEQKKLPKSTFKRKTVDAERSNGPSKLSKSNPPNSIANLAMEEKLVPTDGQDLMFLPVSERRHCGHIYESCYCEDEVIIEDEEAEKDFYFLKYHVCNQFGPNRIRILRRELLGKPEEWRIKKSFKRHGDTFELITTKLINNKTAGNFTTMYNRPKILA